MESKFRWLIFRDKKSPLLKTMVNREYEDEEVEHIMKPTLRNCRGEIEREYRLGELKKKREQRKIISSFSHYSRIKVKKPQLDDVAKEDYAVINFPKVRILDFYSVKIILMIF